MPKIVLYRKKEWVNVTDPYRIYVNDEPIAELEVGKKKVMKVPSHKMVVRAEMDGGYASAPKKIKARKGDTIELHCAGFKYQGLILPYFVVAFGIFAFLQENSNFSWWFALPFLLPVAVYAFYYYVLHPERSLRLIVHKRAQKTA